MKINGFKMKKLLALTFTTLISTYAPSVIAEDTWYLGGLYNAQETSPDDGDFSSDFNTIGVLAGYQYNKYFALEARIATGTSGYTGTFGHPDSTEGSYNEDINSQMSLSIKASYPIFKSLRLYGLAGYTKTKVEISGTATIDAPDGVNFINFPFKITNSDSGFSYGIGLNYQINEQFNIFVDYQILPDFEPDPSYSASWESTTIGVSYSF
jgi:opacity protein-like surface antigen